MGSATWVKEWGQTVLLLLAIAGAVGSLYAFIRSDLRNMEQRLTTRLERVETSVIENGKAIARLEVRMQRVEDDVTWLRNNHRGDR